jgi:hypothetical protein
MARDQARQAEVALARASEAVLAAHAHLIEGVVVRLGDQLCTDRIVDLYCTANALDPSDAAWLRMHTLAHLGAGQSHAARADRPGHGRVWKLVGEELRELLAPHVEGRLRESLRHEFAHARAAIIRVHARNAARFADATAGDGSTTAAVARYIRKMAVPPEISSAVFAFALDRGTAHGVRALTVTAGSGDLKHLAVAPSPERAPLPPEDSSVHPRVQGLTTS